jgi:gas vesicle protein
MIDIAGENAMRRHRTSTTAEVVSFSAGALVGAGLALLYAPKTGHEMRETISGASSNAMTKMKSYGREAQEKMNQNLEKGREFAQERASEFARNEDTEIKY